MLASGGDYNTYSSFFNRSDGALIPTNTGDSIGSSGIRISKIWASDLDTTAITISGTVSANVDMNNNIFTNIGAAGTDFMSDGGLLLASVADATYFVASSTTATSTFAGGMNIQSGGLVVEDDSKQIGIGTTTPTRLMSMYDSTASTTVFAHSGGAGLGGRIILEDTNGTTCTEIYTVNGVVEAAVIGCP